MDYKGRRRLPPVVSSTLWFLLLVLVVGPVVVFFGEALFALILSFFVTMTESIASRLGISSGPVRALILAALLVLAYKLIRWLDGLSALRGKVKRLEQRASSRPQHGAGQAEAFKDEDRTIERLLDDNQKLEAENDRLSLENDSLFAENAELEELNAVLRNELSDSR